MQRNETVTLEAIARAVHDAAREVGDVDVLGIIPAEGESYVEVLLSVKGCQVEPCRFALGILRGLPEHTLRDSITEQIRAHVALHQPT